MQKLVESTISDDLWLHLQEGNSFSYHRLMKLLPLFQDFPLEQTVGSIPITYLCPADYTNGVGRYVIDMLTRWLIPGKQLSIVGSISLNFQFQHFPNHRFYLGQEMIGVKSPQDWLLIQNTLPQLIREMKLNIMAVYHARYIASLRSISLEEKNKLIHENLSSILPLPSKEMDRSIYDHMQNLLFKLSAEEKIGQVKRNIAQLRNSRPKSFDRDVFYEMTHFTILFRDQFSFKRDSRHISRVIALQYLFKKALQEAIQKSPSERHLSLKIVRTSLDTSEEVLGILIGMNLLRDGERFEKQQLLDAILPYLFKATLVKDSFFVDRRDDKIRFFYLEIQKPRLVSFTKEEIKMLRQKLPEEIRKQIENAVHPIFMPRNEEELLRNLIVLCKQLKYIRDLPQVSIHYEKQTNSELSFTILLARLKSKKEPSLRELFALKTAIPFTIDEVRTMGSIQRKKYPKEAAVIRATLSKSLFFRQDHSVDLLKARQRVVFELKQIIGEFRDFNGGIIFKQEEALNLLRKELGNSIEPLLLLENYFYSLRPGIMQTIYDPPILKKHFLLLMDLPKIQLLEKKYLLKVAQEGKFSLYYIAALTPSFKECVAGAVEKLRIASYDLTSTFLHIHEIAALGYIFRADTPEAASQFEKTLTDSLEKWRLSVAE